MNKIYVAEGKIASNIDGIIINNNIIEITKDVFLTIEVNCSFDMTIEILDNIKCAISIISKHDNLNTSYTYNIGKNSNVIVNKLNYDIKTCESIVINLNGEEASLEYVLKSISLNKEKYNVIINHKCKKTYCNLYNHAINIKENIEFEVSSFIKRGITSCISNQYNRIVNLSDNICLIKPNLYIDEYDVIANHSASIGTFNKDELFYLASRGISKDDSFKLLIKGFLISHLKDFDMVEFIKNVIDSEVNYEKGGF